MLENYEQQSMHISSGTCDESKDISYDELDEYQKNIDIFLDVNDPDYDPAVAILKKQDRFSSSLYSYFKFHPFQSLFNIEDEVLNNLLFFDPADQTQKIDANTNISSIQNNESDSTLGKLRQFKPLLGELKFDTQESSPESKDQNESGKRKKTIVTRENSILKNKNYDNCMLNTSLPESSSKLLNYEASTNVYATSPTKIINYDQLQNLEYKSSERLLFTHQQHNVLDINLDQTKLEIKGNDLKKKYQYYLPNSTSSVGNAQSNSAYLPSSSYEQTKKESPEIYFTNNNQSASNLYYISKPSLKPYTANEQENLTSSLHQESNNYGKSVAGSNYAEKNTIESKDVFFELDKVMELIKSSKSWTFEQKIKTSHLIKEAKSILSEITMQAIE